MPEGDGPLGSVCAVTRALDYEERSVRRFLSEPERWYTQRSREKRSGGRRIYWVPHQELKELQRRLLVILRQLTPRSPLLRRTPEDTAGPHPGRRWFIRLDVRDFYPSVTAVHVGAVLDRLGASLEVRGFVLGLTTLNGWLVQGAPTSPGVADLILLDIDSTVFDAAQERGVAITRWSDDVGVSGDHRAAVEAVAARYVAELQELGLDARCTGPLPLSVRRKFLGFYVNGRASLPKAYRRGVQRRVRRAVRYGCSESERRSLIGKICRIAHFHPREAVRQKAALQDAPTVIRDSNEKGES